MTIDKRIKAALKADFGKLYVKEFTTDWRTQRLVRGGEIDVMGHDAVKQLLHDVILELIGPDDEPVYGIARLGNKAQVVGDVAAVENSFKAELRRKVEAL